MTDRELLELAANAAGLVVQRSRLNDPACEDLLIKTRDDHELHLEGWNPLTDDGDALRLAVKLNLDIRFVSEPDGAAVHCFGTYDEFPECDLPRELIGELPRSLEATRRAIVRAAAELGRAKS